MAKDDEDSAGGVELTLFQAKECYVYKIPPRMSTLSYRADEWDVNKWVWEGACRAVSRGSQCEVRLEDAKTGELFARAPVRADGPPAFETVIDSSRYFVLRVEDGEGPHAKHAFVGFGFRERTEAYDFQAAIHDHLHYLSRQKEAEAFAEKFADASRPPIDLSIKEGQSIRLNIPHVSIVRRSSLSVIDPGAAGLFVRTSPVKMPIIDPTGAFMPPPPPAGSLVNNKQSPQVMRQPTGPMASEDKEQEQQQQQQKQQQQQHTALNADDGFGDFQDAL